MVRKDRLNKIKGDTLVAIQKDLPYVQIDLPPQTEHTAISIITQTATKANPHTPEEYVLIFNMYIPPNTNTRSIDLTYVLPYRNNLKTETYILGDFNAYHPIWNQTYQNPLGTCVTAFNEEMNCNLQVARSQPMYLPNKPIWAHLDLTITID